MYGNGYQHHTIIPRTKVMIRLMLHIYNLRKSHCSTPTCGILKSLIIVFKKNNN